MWRRQINVGLVLPFAILVFLISAKAETTETDQVQLQLDVLINGHPLNLIAAFVQMPDGKLASTRSELTELGVAVPGDGAPDEIILLDALPGVSYVYDDSMQSVELELPSTTRLARRLQAGGEGEFIEAQSGTGLVVNYTGYGAANYDIPNGIETFNGASLTLDARGFSKLGTIRQTGIIGTTTFSDFTVLRLDTTLSHSDQNSMLSYRLGDIISGGLSWTRPVRLGGAQVQRNFALRPDLITMPLPSFDGSAEVPSTLKVFVDGVQAYSSDVQPGPFKVDRLPVYTNAGTARIVLTDSSGREVESEQDFFTSPDLLAKGLYDFSLEAGVARRDFGSESFGYDSAPAALASLRYGISDIVTGEAHAEVSADLVDVGVGGLFSAGYLGTFNGAVAGSLFEGENGVFLQAGWSAHFGNLGVSVSTSRTFGDFFDLAAATALPEIGQPLVSSVPRAIDQASLTYSFRELESGIGVNFIHQLDNEGNRSLIVSGSYSQNFSHDITGFVSAFSDFGDTREYGAFVGISMPLGETISASTGANATRDGWTAVAEAARQNDGLPGSHGWRVSHGEGDQRFTAASGNYVSSVGRVDGRIRHQNGLVSGNMSVEGAAVLAGGGLFLGNQIYDSFAIVDAGAAGVPVEYENRFAGKTGKNGKLLLPHLRSFQKNKIAIDVTNLPLNATVGESESIVVPSELSGVVVDFGVKADAAAVLLILTDANGKFITEGAEISLAGTEEPFIMGYDGQVYLTGIGAENSVTVKAGGSQCQANFSYKPETDTQTSIGPLQCL